VLVSSDSFESIYNRYYLSVYRFFLKRQIARELCEDLTSDVFYSCLKSYDKYDSSKATVATWIYTIANNKLKNHYRDKKDFVPLEVAHDALHKSADMEGAVFLTQMKIHLDAALSTVSEREQSIIKLRYYSELNSSEIASELGITAGNVRVILTRALKKIANYFEDNEIRWE